MFPQLILRRVLKPKYTLPLWLLLSPLALASQPCRDAGDDCKIDVQFVGSFLENTCDLNINGGGVNETVNLPTISTVSLSSAGDEAGSQSFNITLSDCPTNKAISLYFASTATGSSATTGNLLNSTGDDYSRSVEIRLRRSDQQQMVINDETTAQDYDVKSGDPVTHQYLASYYATGNDVNAGDIKTAAAIVVNYK